MSPEFQNFLFFALIWVPLGWIGMILIGFFRWYYMYKDINLHEILGWGICVGALSGPFIFIFIAILGLMMINWDVTIIKSRNPTRRYERERSRY